MKILQLAFLVMRIKYCLSRPLFKLLARQTFDDSRFKNQLISDNKKRINTLQNENTRIVEQSEQKTEQIDQLVDQNRLIK